MTYSVPVSGSRSPSSVASMMYGRGDDVRPAVAMGQRHGAHAVAIDVGRDRPIGLQHRQPAAAAVGHQHRLHHRQPDARLVAEAADPAGAGIEVAPGAALRSADSGRGSTGGCRCAARDSCAVMPNCSTQLCSSGGTAWLVICPPIQSNSSVMTTVRPARAPPAPPRRRRGHRRRPHIRLEFRSIPRLFRLSGVLSDWAEGLPLGRLAGQQHLPPPLFPADHQR